MKDKSTIQNTVRDYYGQLTYQHFEQPRRKRQILKNLQPNKIESERNRKLNRPKTRRLNQ